MYKYIVYAKVLKDVSNEINKIMEEMGSDEKVSIETKIAVLEVENELTKEDLERVKDIFYQRKEKLQMITGFKIDEIVIRKV